MNCAPEPVPPETRNQRLHDPIPLMEKRDKIPGMVTCPACARSVALASAFWCPYCGGSLSEAETRTATDQTASPYPPLEDARFAPGLIFASRYRIVSLLGRGAMGEVYRADDTRLGQPIALKLLAFRGTPGRETFKRFTDEVRLARGIAHPNVCRVYDIGEAEGWHYLSMEYVDGETLESLMRRIGQLPPGKALEIVRQLFAGVAAAHDRGILHRDLKPSNIMVDGRGLVRILDFGLAVSTTEGTVREIAGTPAYMAPEQVVGGRVTERTDLFALGLIVYELFTGRRLFAAQTLADRLHLGDTTVSPVLGSEVDPQIAGILRACLQHDPDARPRTALSVAARLPGGDPLAAAVAEGRVPSPAVVAAAPRQGTLPLSSRGRCWRRSWLGPQASRGRVRF
jgi:serine/threonine protein kinase